MYLLAQVQSAGFLEQWQSAATTTLGFFWMALWAFILGYVVSSMIQVLVTQERMQESMGETGAKSVGLGAFFGFISSSCSFAALSTTRALYQKGAGFIPAMSFLLASTNLVIELGIVIFIFLGLEFAVAEYVGGILLILFMWIFVTITYPEDLIKSTRKKLDERQSTEEDTEKTWTEKIKSREGWKKIADQYWMEWGMVWKDVSIGFTVAGIAAVFIPASFYETLFIGVGQSGQDYSFFQLLEHVLIGPVVAFFTFIGSMGNIPLAAVLYGSGVSFAGVMAFIFSDLVVFPILRINAQYYGWKMSFYILATLLFALVGSALILHYGFDLIGFLPQGGGKSIIDREFFKIDYTFFFNAAFLIISGMLAWLSWSASKDEDDGGHDHSGGKDWIEVTLKYLAFISYAWLAAGILMKLFM
jgi:uncharacterized membrane protein YraQ (UPF0718 family)